MPLQDWLQRLETPIEAGRSTGDLQKQYNLMRNQIQGATPAMAETLRAQLGGRGFRVGESGFADTPMAQMLTAGQRNLSEAASNIYLDEAKGAREMAGLNLQRLLGAGGLEVQSQAAGAQAHAAKLAADTAAQRLAWEKEQWGQEFPWQQERASMGDLFGMMGMMGSSQQQAYAPWYQANVNWATQ